jgi:hypothetical protein
MPKLRRRNVGVEMCDHVDGGRGGCAPFLRQFLEARSANGDDRKLGRDEEAVGQDQHHDGDQAERGRELHAGIVAFLRRG